MSDERQRLLDQLDEEFFLFIWRVKDNTARLFHALGVRAEQVLVLELINRGLQHPKDIAKAIQWDAPLLSHYLAKLEDRGFIERTLDPEDRRRTKIRITSSGKQALRKAREAWHAYTSRVLHDLSDDELRMLSQLLARILAAQEDPA
jgi:DNA-binding MarR family transcriptional regulator